MPTRVPILLTIAVVALTGCTGGSNATPDEDPGEFMSGLVRQIAAGQYDQAWISLHPAHKRVATRQEYVECESLDVAPAKVPQIDVLGVKDETLRVEGEADEAAGAAITMRVSVPKTDGGTPDRITETFHAVAVDDSWAWVLPAARYRAYRENRCPGAT